MNKLQNVDLLNGYKIQKFKQRQSSFFKELSDIQNKISAHSFSSKQSFSDIKDFFQTAHHIFDDSLVQTQSFFYDQLEDQFYEKTDGIENPFQIVNYKMNLINSMNDHLQKKYYEIFKVQNRHFVLALQTMNGFMTHNVSKFCKKFQLLLDSYENLKIQNQKIKQEAFERTQNLINQVQNLVQKNNEIQKDGQSKQNKENTKIQINKEIDNIQQQNQKFQDQLEKETKKILQGSSMTEILQQFLGEENLQSRKSQDLIENDMIALVQDILQEKQKYNSQCQELHLRFENLKNFCKIYFNTIFKTKTEVEAQIEILENGIKENKGNNPDVQLFCYIYDDIVDEDYQVIHEDMKNTLKDVLLDTLRLIENNLSQEKLQQKFIQIIWSEQEISEKLIEVTLQKAFGDSYKKSYSEILQKNQGVVYYKQLQQLILSEYLQRHAQFLQKSHQNFNFIDVSKKGYINRNQFEELIDFLDPFSTFNIDKQYLLKLSDPFDHDYITFSKFIYASASVCQKDQIIKQ